MERLINRQIVDADLADWRKLSQPLHARYRIVHFAEEADFVSAVADVVEGDSRHLDVRLTHGHVDLSLCTRDDGLWVTQKDIDLARKISAVAQRNGLIADSGTVTQLEIGLDTDHEDRIGSFWSVLLAGSPENNIFDSIFVAAVSAGGLSSIRPEHHPSPFSRTLMAIGSASVRPRDVESVNYRFSRQPLETLRLGRSQSRCDSLAAAIGVCSGYPNMKLLLVFAVRMAHIEETGLSKRIESFHYLRG